MNKIEYALRLAKDCTYADEMMESAKEHLRNVIDEALKEVLPQADVIKSVCVAEGCDLPATCNGKCGGHCECLAG